jgi:hypothetical protein
MKRIAFLLLVWGAAAAGAAGLNPAYVKALAANRVQVPVDAAGVTLVRAYGSLFVARGVILPPRVLLDSAEAVRRFQQGAKLKSAVLGGVTIRLQAKAADALANAVRAARREGLSITPRGGSSAASRTFDEALGFWNRRVQGGLTHWRSQLDPANARAIRAGPLLSQFRAIMQEEQRGHFFALHQEKSILESVAPPGGSQHHWGLALDVEQYAQPRVRAILAANGWHQTVRSDLPHFTYLGVTGKEALEARGLKPVKVGSQLFWIPGMAGP